MIRVFIGYDPREAEAFWVLSHSIQRLTSVPVSITPLALPQLSSVLTRERHPLQSTDFSFSRFLVPWLSDFAGWSLFIDCDMLALRDFKELWRLRDEKKAVMVVKHNHVPKETTKFLGEPQTMYAKKNWSSVMLFNNAKCFNLSPWVIDTADGLTLHQFKWLEDEELIGELPSEWNHLVGYDAPRKDVALVHYTLGGPYFKEHRGCEYSEEWFAEKKLLTGDAS